MRLVTAAILFLCLTSPAQALKINCDEVRAYVAQHGKAKAIAYAIKNGATFQQLREARRCLR